MAPKKTNGNNKKSFDRREWITCAAVLIALAVIIGVFFATGIFGGSKPAADGNNAPAAFENASTLYATIVVKDYGTIKAELYPDIAPITVANFVKLANEGFYDGLTFHRIISGFMIQGGDPLGNGTGGSGVNIKGEFAQNGVKNDLKHTRGVLSMARSSMPDSASSQFFIMHQDAPHLDGAYAAFGMVTEGIEVVDAICAGTPVTDRNGTVTKANQPVITSIRVTTEK